MIDPHHPAHSAARRTLLWMDRNKITMAVGWSRLILRLGARIDQVAACLFKNREKAFVGHRGIRACEMHPGSRDTIPNPAGKRSDRKRERPRR
jgi:hypothetical protein